MSAATNSPIRRFKLPRTFLKGSSNTNKIAYIGQRPGPEVQTPLQINMN